MGWFHPIVYGGMHAKRKGLLHHHVCSVGPAHPGVRMLWSCTHTRCRKETFLVCAECELTEGAAQNLDTLMDSFVVDRPANKTMPTPKKSIVWDNVGYGNTNRRQAK